MKVEVTGPDGSPMAKSYTTDDVIFEYQLNFLYGVALSACNSDEMRKEVRGSKDFLRDYMYRR